MSVGRSLALVLGGILLSLALTAVIAWVAFWAIYTLAGYSIPYNVWTVLAFWFGCLIVSVIRGANKDGN